VPARTTSPTATRSSIINNKHRKKLKDEHTGDAIALPRSNQNIIYAESCFNSDFVPEPS